MKSDSKPEIDSKSSVSQDSKSKNEIKKEKLKERDRRRREQKKLERELAKNTEKSIEQLADEVDQKMKIDKTTDKKSKDRVKRDDRKKDEKVKADGSSKNTKKLPKTEVPTLRNDQKSEKPGKKEKVKSDHKKTSKKAQETAEQFPTKVIIRNIPPFCTSEEFLALLDNFLPDYTYYNFSVADQSLMPWHTCTAYFNFKTHEMTNHFFQRWNNFMIVRTKFSEDEAENRKVSETEQPNYPLQVEIATFQKLPTDQSGDVVDKKENFMDLRKELGLSGKIFNSLEFKQFLKQDQKDKKEAGENQDSQAKLDQFMQDMESRKSAMDSKKKSTEC